MGAERSYHDPMSGKLSNDSSCTVLFPVSGRSFKGILQACVPGQNYEKMKFDNFVL